MGLLAFGCVSLTQAQQTVPKAEVKAVNPTEVTKQQLVTPSPVKVERAVVPQQKMEQQAQPKPATPKAVNVRKVHAVQTVRRID